MRPRRLILIRAGIAVGLTVLAVVLYTIYKPTPPLEPWKRPLKIWGDRQFTPIGNSDVVNLALTQQIKVNFTTVLTDDQYKKLVQTLAECLTIYKTSDWNKFQSFVQKRHGLISADGEQVLKSLRIFNVPLSELHLRYRQIFTSWRQWPPSTGWEMVRALWTSDYFHGGYWDGIDLSDARIEVFQQVAPITGQEQVEQMKKMAPLQMGWGWSRSDFTFPIDSPPYTYALVYFIIKHQAPDPAWPDFLWLYWNPTLKEWILDHVGMAYTGDKSHHGYMEF